MKLLPCPFCSGEAEITRIGDHRQSTQYECQECGCNLETGEEFNHGARWNTRPGEDKLRSLLGRARDQIEFMQECHNSEMGQGIITEINEALK